MKIAPNRVLLVFKNWEDQKKELEGLLRAGTTDERTLRQLQLAYFREAFHRLNADARPDEQPFLPLIVNQVRRLEKQQYPNLFIRLISRLKDQWLDGPAYLTKLLRQREANIISLQQQLRASGFGHIAGRLDRHLSAEQQNVTLPLDAMLGEQKRLTFQLHFVQDSAGNFRFDRVDGALQDKGRQGRTFSFQLDDWPNLTADQARNLLEGRAMRQNYTDTSGFTNQRWIALSTDGTRHYGPENAFDLRNALDAFPAITRDKEDLVKCLEHGAVVPTHWRFDGQFQTIYVQADPANRTLKLFDAQQRPVTAEKINDAMSRKAAIKQTRISSQRKTNVARRGQRV